MGVTLRVKNINQLVEQFDIGLGARPSVRLGLRISGPAAAYALVWEWGRVDINPGPKTMWSTNPDGEATVLTITAPYGYIRFNKDKYRKIVQEELEKVQWWRLWPKQMPRAIEQALTVAAQRCAQLIAETAPFDKGDLREAIQAAQIIDAGQVDIITDRVSFRPRIRV